MNCVSPAKQERSLCLKLMLLQTLAFFANKLHKNRTKTAPLFKPYLSFQVLFPANAVVAI